MRRALLVAALVLSAPASASAAPFGELPFRAVTGQVSCLRATGAPGELVRSLSRETTSDAGAQILSAGPAGLTRVADLRADASQDCPRAAARANGAGIVAIQSYGLPGPRTIRASLREPGGRWGTMVEVTGAEDLADGVPLAVSVSDQADAVLAIATRPAPSRIAITAIRRTPAGGFGARETLFSATSPSNAATVQAGMTAAGEAVVAWSYLPRKGAPRELWVTVAAPGAAFRAPVQVGEVRVGSPFGLAVGDGGYALLAFATGSEVRVAERSPDGDFSAATTVARADDLIAVYPTAAVRADGAAVVGWLRVLDGAMSAAVRDRPGPFGTPVTLTRRTPFGLSRGLLAGLVRPVTDDVDESGENLWGDAEFPLAAIAGDGRALLTWTTQTDRDGVWWGAPQSATLPLSGGPAETRTHGAELRDATSMTPVLLADGRFAVAWASNHNDGQIGLAVEGVASAPDVKAPRVRVRPPARRVLAATESLELPVTCSAACIVRAQVGDAVLDAFGSIELDSAGSSTLELEPILAPIATLHGGTVRVRLRYGAADSRRARTATLALRLRRAPGRPVPRIAGVVARRDGNDVVVTWRTNRAASRELFGVSASAERGTASLAVLEAHGGPRRFRVRFRNLPAARFVTVATVLDDVLPVRGTTVAVQG